MWRRFGEFKIRTFYTTLLCLVFSIYFVINRNLSSNTEFRIFLDNLIPFAAPWSFAYISYLGLVWGSVLYATFFMDLNNYKKFIFSMLTVQFIAYLVYILLPVYISRPALNYDGLGMDLVRTIYNTDMPNTLTPSLHVANSWLIALTMTKRYFIRGILVIWAILIILSTLFIKQHFVVDVMSGIVLSTITYIIFDKYWNTGINLWWIINGIKKALGFEI